MHLVLTHNHASAMKLISYRVQQHFGKAPGYAGHDLKELLSCLPLISKADLIKQSQENTDSMLREAILFSETSGTTSTPLQTPRSKHDLNWNVLNQINAYKPLIQAGVDRVCVLHPSILSPFIEGSSRALHELGVGHVRLYPIPKVCDYKRMYDVIDRYRITAIMSTPSLIYKILYEFKKIDSGKLPASLRKILVTGERFSIENLSNMRRILGDDSFVTPFVYGSSETATIMIGEPNGTYRPILEDFVFEIIGKEQKDSSSITGNLLVTWLRGGMLPIIRYDTGDIFTAQRPHRNFNYTFHFEGRADKDGLSIDQQKIIEKIVYSQPAPIFHFDCTTNFSQKKLILSVITHSSDSISSEIIGKQITDAIGDNWMCSVNLNPENHIFQEFSPSPKMRKFYYVK